MGFEIINKLKKEKGLTNAQLAQMSGVTLSTLDKITAGINTNPKLDTLQAICRALGCRLDDFDDAPNIRELLTIGERDMIKKYRALDTYGQDAVSAVLDCEHKRCVEQVAEQHPLEIAARAGVRLKRSDDLDSIPLIGEDSEVP